MYGKCIGREGIRWNIRCSRVGFFCCNDSEWAVFIDFHGASSFVLCLMYIFFLWVGPVMNGAYGECRSGLRVVGFGRVYYNDFFVFVLLFVFCFVFCFLLFIMA